MQRLLGLLTQVASNITCGSPPLLGFLVLVNLSDS